MPHVVSLESPLSNQPSSRDIFVAVTHSKGPSAVLTSGGQVPFFHLNPHLATVHRFTSRPVPSYALMKNLFRPTAALGIREASSAPDQPGLYIWFGKLDIGEGDWDSRRAGSNARASEYLEKALHHHCEKFEKQEISINAEAHFSTRWQGKLLEEITHRFGQVLINTDGRPKNARVERVLSDDVNRGLLVRIIESSFPMFFGPLYIGKATSQSLRQRLSQHSSRFLELWEQKGLGEGLASQYPTNFAERAFLMGFSPEDLYFSCLPVVPDADSNWTSSQLEDAIGVAEWLLNRWATPMLGKD